MRFVSQRRKDDCGVACVAMLANVDYEQALAAFRFRPRQNRRTTSRQVIDAMRRLGFAAGSDRLLPLRARAPDLPAIIKWVGPSNSVNRFHWCVYDPKDGILLDPNGDAARIAGKLNSQTTHYIAFKRSAA